MFRSTLKGLEWIVVGNGLHYILKITYIYIYIYIFININIYIYICKCVSCNVFHALNVILYFGRSKCEVFAGHGMILYQSGCSKVF